MPRGISRASTCTWAVPLSVAAAVAEGSPSAASALPSTPSSSNRARLRASPRTSRAQPRKSCAQTSEAVMQSKLVVAQHRAGLIEGGVVVESTVSDRVEWCQRAEGVADRAAELEMIVEGVLTIEVRVGKGRDIAVRVVDGELQTLVSRGRLVDALHDAAVVDDCAERQRAACPVERDRAAGAWCADRTAHCRRSGSARVVERRVTFYRVD